VATLGNNREMKTIFVAHIESGNDLVRCVFHISDSQVTRIVHTCVSKKIADHLKVGQVYLCRTEEIIAEISLKIKTSPPQHRQSQ
jgi:predicted ferric reductase